MFRRNESNLTNTLKCVFEILKIHIGRVARLELFYSYPCLGCS